MSTGIRVEGFEALRGGRALQLEYTPAATPHLAAPGGRSGVPPRTGWSP